MENTFLLLDTNTFLHYISLDQIEWKEQFPNQKVVLLICPPVIRELNKHKDTPRTPKLRDRAAAALRNIDCWADLSPPILLRDMVELQFIIHDSTIEFGAHNLVRDIADDHIIAMLIELKAQVSSSSVVLLTKDVGLKLKARIHGFSVASLPDSVSLPAEILPVEKKIRELETQVKDLQNARPKLKLTFSGGNSRLNLCFQRAQHLSEQDITNLLTNLKAKYPKMAEQAKTSKADRGTGSLDGLFVMAKGLSSIPSESIRQYNESLGGFIDSYERYLNRLSAFYDWESRTAALNITLHNDGSCPADDIDIFMHFPDGFELFRKEDYEKEPKTPEAPRRPRSMLELASEGSNFGASLSNPLYSYPNDVGNSRLAVGKQNVSGPRIKRSSSYDVRVTVQRAKHGIDEALDVMYVTFKQLADAQSFAIDYKIHASNLPSSVVGKLHVVI